MSMFSQFLAMAFWASVTTNAELAVAYRRYLIQGKGMIPSAKPVIVSNVDCYVMCATKCSLDHLCMSFYYGNSECGLYHTREMTLTYSPVHNYYYHRREPGVCDICPYSADDRIYMYGSSSFVICPALVNFTVAADACSCVGGRLAYITNNSTQTFVQEMFKDHRAKSIPIDVFAWIGIKGTYNPYRWFLMNGQKATYFNWAANEPNGNGNLALAPHTFGSYQWVDENINTQHSYVCEYPNNI